MLSRLRETSMRCPPSLSLANISTRTEMRACCSVSEQGFWLEKGMDEDELRT